MPNCLYILAPPSTTTTTNKMRLIILLFAFLLTNLCYAKTAHAHDLIHETCNKCAQNDPNLSYTFCVASFQAAIHRHCPPTSLRQLGLISITLTKRNVTSTRYYINHNLLNDTRWDPYTRACLADCFNLYSDVIPSLEQALRDYKSKHYSDANIRLSSVIDAAATCEDAFSQEQQEQDLALVSVSPLTKHNNHTFQLAAIALSIIDMLH